MNPDTVLYRQAHPKFMDGGNLTSQVFMIFPRDDGLLSTYDGDMISAKDSHFHYTTVLNNVSDSVWGVSKAEADACGVPASPDPLPNFPEHSKIEFGNRDNKESRVIAKRLKSLAQARGCQYRP